jgi:hypothetical protein
VQPEGAKSLTNDNEQTFGGDEQLVIRCRTRRQALRCPLGANITHPDPSRKGVRSQEVHVDATTEVTAIIAAAAAMATFVTFIAGLPTSPFPEMAHMEDQGAMEVC